MVVATTDALKLVPRLPFTEKPLGTWDLSLEDAPMEEFGTMDVVEFLQCRDVMQERDGEPRPRYRLEVT
jgi:hypothetical protein